MPKRKTAHRKIGTRRQSDIINHIAMVIDNSYSMGHLEARVADVFDAQVDYLRRKSRELGQQTRVSVYQFGSNIDCLAWDTDVDRVGSLRDLYAADGGMTRLIDASCTAIEDLQEISQRYGDHSFLMWVITDGGENASVMCDRRDLKQMINDLDDNWTVACMVPNNKGVHYAKQCGFPLGCIAQWDATSIRGLDEAAYEFQAALDNYMIGRSNGIRSTNTFYTDTSNLKVKDLKGRLRAINAKQYKVLKGTKDGEQIRDLVTRRTRNYVKGSAYYELVKPEKVQHYKQVLVQNKESDKLYGGDQARNIIGLGGADARVRPGDHGKWRIFIQSTSVNRKIPRGTQVVVMK